MKKHKKVRKPYKVHLISSSLVSCSINSTEVQKEQFFPFMRVYDRHYKKKMELDKAKNGEEIQMKIAVSVSKAR